MVLPRLPMSCSMTPISSISSANAIAAYQPQSTQTKAAPSQPAQDSVQLSKTAQAALAGGDADHDGDSH